MNAENIKNMLLLMQAFKANLDQCSIEDKDDKQEIDRVRNELEKVQEKVKNLMKMSETLKLESEKQLIYDVIVDYLRGISELDQVVKVIQNRNSKWYKKIDWKKLVGKSAMTLLPFFLEFMNNEEKE